METCHSWKWRQGNRYYFRCFEPDKVKLLDRCANIENAGIGFRLHSDFMLTNQNPLYMIEMAVTRKTWKEPGYILVPNERSSVESAIRSLEAVWQIMSEHEIGSLEIGKLADFVILDKDPRSVNPDKIKEIHILETWRNGERVYVKN